MHDTLTPEIANGASSNNRAETNRENARKSTGPRTEAGKQRSSLNALRHGLTGHTVVLPSDDLVAYERHCKGFFNQYQPKNPTEVQLTQTVADLSWRLNRATAFDMAKVFREQSQAFANLALYEHRLNVRHDKALKQLREMQEQRQRQDLWVMPEAARLLKMHKAKGVPYNPVDDGFVFSERDIETYIQRQDRKNQAHAAMV